MVQRGSRSHDEQNGTHSYLSGSAGDVVQARDVHGGVHFHETGPASGAVPRQLPADVRGFVNRVADLEQLEALLAGEEHKPSSVSVCVIVGTAGVGKTSLAIHWAHRARLRFPDGQLYVNLRGYDPGAPVAPTQVLEHFLASLDVPVGVVPASLEDRAAFFRSRVADKRILVVLDNAATVSQVRPLLAGSDSSLTLVTSRSRLSGLVVRNSALRLTLRVFPEPDAVSLLRTTTSAYRTGDVTGDVAELARLCAGLPLALRIAAERAAARPQMPLSKLISDLRSESSLWDALSADDDEEADAVRTVFAWSYRALPEDAARLFRLLGLHPGAEFSAHAAAALAMVTIDSVQRLLDTLVGAHLLEQIAAERYQFHDLLRAYAFDQTRHYDSEADRRAAVARVLSWYQHTADAVADYAVGFEHVQLDPLADGVCPLQFTDAAEAGAWFVAERSNLVAAVRTAADYGWDRIAWQIPANLRNMYRRFRLLGDWSLSSRLGLKAARHAGDLFGQALLLESLGSFSMESHRIAEAADFYNGSLEIHRRLGRTDHEASVLNLVGLLEIERHRLAAAIDYINRCAAICDENDYRNLEGNPPANLCRAHLEAGRPGEALPYGRISLEFHRLIGDRDGELETLVLLARAALELNELDEVSRAVAAAFTIAGESGNPAQEADVFLCHGMVSQHIGKADDALVAYQRTVSLQRRLGNPIREMMALDLVGTVYCEMARYDEAAAFHRRALFVYREFGDSWRSAVAADRLAIALDRGGFPEEARSFWREASSLLVSFDDPRAIALKEEIAARLERPGEHNAAQ